MSDNMVMPLLTIAGERHKFVDERKRWGALPQQMDARSVNVMCDVCGCFPDKVVRFNELYGGLLDICASCLRDALNMVTGDDER